MRDIIIIAVIVLLIFGGGSLAEKYLEESEKEIINKFDEFHRDIRSGDMSHLDELDELYSIWEKSKVKWHILANHQEIDEIEAELMRFMEAYEIGDEKEALYCISEIRFRINDMHKGEKFELVNIL